MTTALLILISILGLIFILKVLIKVEGMQRDMARLQGRLNVLKEATGDLSEAVDGVIDDIESDVGASAELPGTVTALFGEEAVTFIAESKPFLLDVRGEEEFRSAHLPGAVNIPLPELSSRLAAIPADGTPVLVYCQRGLRSREACTHLTKRTDQIFMLEGGLDQWPGPTEPEA